MSKWLVFKNSHFDLKSTLSHSVSFTIKCNNFLVGRIIKINPHLGQCTMMSQSHLVIKCTIKFELKYGSIQATKSPEMQANKNEYTQQQKLWSMPPIPIVQVDNKKSAYSNLLLCFKIFFVNIWHYLKFRYCQKTLVAQNNAFIWLLVHLSCGLVFTCLHNYTNTKKVMVL